MKLVRHQLWVILGVVATIRAASPLTMTIVLGHSMEPTLRPGGSYVLDRGYYSSHPLCRGDILVFRYSGDTYIKRVYALPGDQVRLLTDDDGDDQLLEPWEVARYQGARPESLLAGYHVVSVTIPAGHCFVVGDNSLNSIDSRQFGPVPISTILGRVMQ
jgi:signal peptidase I